MKNEKKRCNMLDYLLQISEQIIALFRQHGAQE